MTAPWFDWEECIRQERQYTAGWDFIMSEATALPVPPDKWVDMGMRDAERRLKAPEGYADPAKVSAAIRGT